MNDTLQAYFDRYAETTQLEWQIQDAAERQWDVEYIYIFICAILIFLGICAAVQKLKSKRNGTTD